MATMEPDKIEIDEVRYNELLESERMLQCLEGAGVDNWSGYDFACEMMNEE